MIRRPKKLTIAAAAVGAAAALGPVAPIRAEDAPAPAAEAAREETAAARLERALGQVADGVPFGSGIRVAVLPIRGPGEGRAECRLGRLAADRGAAALAARGARTIERGAAEALREAERLRPNGPLGVPEARVAGLYLGADAALGGRVREVEGGYEVSLHLSGGGAEGKTMATASVRLGRDEARALLEGADPAADASGAPAPAALLPPNIRCDRAVLVQRKKPDGTDAAPAVWDGKPLAPGDRFQLRFQAADPCWLSVMVRESKGAVRRLIPADAAQAAARIEGGVEVTLPAGGGNLWYPVEGPAGLDTFYVVVVRDLAQMPPAPAAGATGAAARRPAGAEWAAIMWDQEAVRAAAELDAHAHVFAFEYRTRRAVESIMTGEPLLDEARARSLGEPVMGAPVEVAWEGGKLNVGRSRVEGRDRIVERFAIEVR